MDIQTVLKALPTTPCYDSSEDGRRHAQKVLNFIRHADTSATLALVGEEVDGDYVEKWRVETSEGPTRDLMSVNIVRV